MTAKCVDLLYRAQAIQCPAAEEEDDDAKGKKLRS